MDALLFENDEFDQRIGRTNNRLNDWETRHVKSRCHARRDRILQIDRILVNAQRSGPGNKALLQERERMIAVMKRYQVALSPHKLLPVEILQEIFRLVSAGYLNVTARAQDPPLALCRVCSSWRQIVVQMPELWNTVQFSAGTTLTRMQKLAAAQLWFSRAGDMSLSLTLLDSPNDKSPAVDFVANLIAPFSLRFKYLHVAFNTDQINTLLSLPAGALDGVEECRILLDASFTLDALIMPWQLPITFFGPSSSLRGLRIQLSPLVYPQYFIFPWHQLQSFRCDSSIDAAQCTPILLACRSLRQLHLRIFGIRYTPPSTAEIYLPELVSLAIQLCDPEPYDTFFLPLILPKLKSLWIYNYDGIPWSPDMYSSLLNRSRCSLQHISLGSINITDPHDVLRLFQLTPDLISITLSHSTPVGSDLLQRIGRGEIGRSLVKLFLKGKRKLEPLLAMLEMRHQLMTAADFNRVGQHALSALTFMETHCDSEEVHIYEGRIKKLRSYGFELNLLPMVEGYYFQL